MENVLHNLESEDSKVRGKAIKTINDLLEKCWTENNLEEIASFLENLPTRLENPKKTCGVFKKHFNTLTGIGVSDSRFTIHLALSIEKLLNNPYYQIGDQEKFLRIGNVCEYLASHTNEINEFIYLKKATVAYTRASKPNEAERLTKIKQEKISRYARIGLQEFNIPAEALSDIHKEAEKIKQTLLSKKYEDTIDNISSWDPFQILLHKQDLISQGNQGLSFFEKLPGVIISAQVTSDGRILNQNDSDINLRALHRGFKEWKIIAGICLFYFGELLTELLATDHSDYTKRVGYLAKFLSYSSDGSEEEGKFALRIVLNFIEKKHLECLSVSIPYIERSIRNMAKNFGFNSIRLDADIKQPEIFKILNFLKDAKVVLGLSEKLCESLEATLLMDEKGFGLNIRNNIAHGVMNYDEYNMFNSYLIIYLLIQIAGRGIPRE